MTDKISKFLDKGIESINYKISTMDKERDKEKIQHLKAAIQDIKSAQYHLSVEPEEIDKNFQAFLKEESNVVLTCTLEPSPQDNHYTANIYSEEISGDELFELAHQLNRKSFEQLNIVILAGNK